MNPGGDACFQCRCDTARATTFPAQKQRQAELLQPWRPYRNNVFDTVVDDGRTRRIGRHLGHPASGSGLLVVAHRTGTG